MRSGGWLIPPGGFERLRTANKVYGSGRQKAVIAEAGKGRKPVVPGPTDRNTVGADVIAEIGVHQLAIADDKAFLYGQPRGGLIARHPARADVGTRRDPGIR